MALDFIFRLVLYSHEDVSFNFMCLNLLEGIKQDAKNYRGITITTTISKIFESVFKRKNNAFHYGNAESVAARFYRMFLFDELFTHSGRIHQK